MNNESLVFYRKLSQIYDQIFPVELSTVDFLEDAGARPGARVLDLACGSGLYTDALLEAGVEAYGLDASPDLIEQARARSDRPERFVLADMRELGAPAFAAGVPGSPGVLPASFELIFCIGNSLSHLESVADVLAVLRAAAGALQAPGGRMVIQFVDMEEIDVGSARQLPVLPAGGYMFERTYRRADRDRIVFDAALVHTETGDRDTIRNELLLFRTDDVVGWLTASGFRDVEVWGGFQRQPLGNSWVRVVSAAT